MLLPAIQRHFVWRKEQICNLFDSILQGYPIGTFLFWQVDDNERHHYAFYEFIREYSEHESQRYNRPAPRSLPPGIIGVLDGQQRLNSLFVALCGSYSGFIGGQGHPRHQLDNYPAAELFIDLAFQPDEEDSHRYLFAFLNEWEQRVENWKEGRMWFPVRRVYHCANDQSIEHDHAEYVKSLTTKITPPERRRHHLTTLMLLRRRIREEQLIRYFPIMGRNLSEALRIFIRANNGGTRVSDAEMIFATIAAHWPEGREKIERLQLSLNQPSDRYQFQVSHIMLACLALSGSPIRLKIESFTPVHVDQIRDQWDVIAELLKTSAKLLEEWGLSGNNAVSVNAVTAVALLLQAEININDSKEHLRQFCLRTLICELYKRPESILRFIRGYAQENLCSNKVFNVGHFEEALSNQTGKNIQISAEYLEELLMLPIWDKRTYVLLSLLHPHHAQHQQSFHKDHIHPNSRFAHLEKLGISNEEAQRWMHWKDLMPNLQLLQGQVNIEKRAKPFREWLCDYRPIEKDRMLFLDQNNIPADLSLDFCDFGQFFEERKAKLRSRLKVLLKVAAPDSSQT